MKKSRRRSASEGAGLVERYGASGLTQREFAARSDVTVATLQYWLRKTKTGGGGEASAEQFRFVEVIGKESKGAPTGGMSMELGNGLTLRFESLPSPGYLVSVAAAFEKVG